MLKFILGPAASGKTHRVLSEIKECSLSGEEVILLVPEQFSFESEKAVLDFLGEAAALRVNVVSFTRLCDEIERETGNLSGRSVTEADKLILMRRAVKLAAPSLKRWQKYARSPSFASVMVDTVSEFKLNAISPEDLADAAAASEDAALCLKLLDTAEIYSCYNALLLSGFSDPSDRLESIYRKLEYHRFFENKRVFIDSFKSFTGCQLKILDRIIAQALEVTVSLCCEEGRPDLLDTFSGVRRTADRIKRIAASHGVKCSQPLILKENFYNAPELKALERLMAKGECEKMLSPNITVCKAESCFDEAEFTARTIRKTVRELGARYRDFVIIARDPAAYEDALASACAKNGVPCFIDRSFSLISLPPARAAAAAMEAALGLTTERILSFNKSGIELLSAEDLSLLENYTYLWNIDGSLWEKEWDMNPRGFISGEGSPADSEALAEINRLRIKASAPLIKFAKSFCGNAESMAAAIFKLFEQLHARNAFLRLYEAQKAQGNTAFADALRQSWDALSELFECMAASLGDSEISPTEFADAFKSAASLTSVGVTPQTLDEAIFGAADRIRPSRPKYAFILGANQGVFPKTPSASGIFGNAERRSLSALGLDIPDKTVNAAIDEGFLVYSNLCCPTHKLFISYSASSNEGAALEASGFVNEITEALGCRIIAEPAPLSAENLPETAEAAFSQTCRRLSYNQSEAKSLISSLPPEYSPRIAAALKPQRPDFSLSAEIAEELFGKSIHMSPSKFDNFSRCKFMFFCHDGLRLKRLQPADFDVLQRGTLVHYVLQRLIESHGKEICRLSDAELAAEVDSLTEEYLNSIEGYRSVETAKSKYLVSVLKRSLKYVALRLRDEFSQSEFEPIRCELKIGAEGEIPEIEFPIDDERRLLLSGTVDRVDSWNGYLRIIDYKTGHRDFKLPDILFGQNMQMLIYLYAVCSNSGKKSAGIFYMPARRIKAGAPKDRRMSGIMPESMELVTAMEKANGGEFIPKLTSSPSDSFIAEEDFDTIFDFIERRLRAAGAGIFSGDIAANPIDGLDSSACKYCDYAAICRIEDEKHECVPRLSNAEVINIIKEEAEENGI